MPELPEVETIVRELRAAGIIGRKITAGAVRWPPLIRGHSAAGFQKRLRGKRILGVVRRGKFIVIALSDRLYLLVHLRMTGQFSLAGAGRPREKHQYIILRLSNGRELRYRDTRKFGRWQLTADPATVLGGLGPEPLAASFKPADLSERLKKHRRQLKPLLLDQRIIAGLGNIYADEALWEAQLHPRRISDSLSAQETLKLFKAIQGVLRRGIRHKGTSLGTGIGNYSRLGQRIGMNQERLNVYQRGGSPCPRCHTPIKRIIVGQRSSHICPGCQKPRAAASSQ